MNFRRTPIFALLALLLTACGSTSLAPKPAPLPEVKSTLSITTKWSKSLDSAEWVRLQPSVAGDVLAAVSGEKQFSVLDVNTGKLRWEFDLPNTASGAVAVADDLIVATTIKGEVLAFELGGKPRWNTRVASELTAAPAISGGMVLVRGSDGRLTALAANDGAVKWTYARQQPALLLQNFAPPLVVGDVVYLGQAGGRLAALGLKDGRVLWESQVSLPRGVSEIERMTDVVAPPVLNDGLVCAVAFQGRLACFNIQDGNLVWSREVSSSSGLAIDKKAVYVTDEKGNVAAYDRDGGRSLWKQDKLTARELSGPAVMGKTLLLGDFEGYLHFINTEDGSLIDQQSTDGGAIVVAPKVINGHWLVQTQDGGLYLLGQK